LILSTIIMPLSEPENIRVKGHSYLKIMCRVGLTCVAKELYLLYWRRKAKLSDFTLLL
jgi:hypothetical protein